MAILGIPIDNGNDDKGKEFLKSLCYADYFKKHEVNGCEHKFNRAKYKFCGECGAPSKKTEEASCYGDLIGEIAEDVAEITGLYVSYSYDKAGWILGVELQGDYKECLRKVDKAIPVLNKYFPNERPEFVDK